MSGRLRGEGGQVAGMEAVPFGLLILSVGLLVLAHTWAVVDAKFVTATAAREATRAFVEAPSASAGDAAAGRVAADRVQQAGRDPADLELDRLGPGFGRCAPAGHEARLPVPSVGVPWRPDRPAVVVRARHREVVDPYRSGLSGLADCDGEP